LASGKSQLCYLTAVQEVRKSTLLMLIDYDMREKSVRAALIERGLTPEEIEEVVYYVPMPPLLTANAGSGWWSRSPKWRPGP